MDTCGMRTSASAWTEEPNVAVDPREYDVPSSSRVGDISVLHPSDIVIIDVHVYTFKITYMKTWNQL